MKRSALCILIALALIGCASHAKYTHPTKNRDDFEYDKSKCMQVASEYAASVGSKDNMFIISNQTEQCLEKQYGWVKAK